MLQFRIAALTTSKPYRFAKKTFLMSFQYHTILVRKGKRSELPQGHASGNRSEKCYVTKLYKHVTFSYLSCVGYLS